MRQLVTIRTVKELIPIEGADLIELAKIDGWQCVVKKGDFKVGDPGLYFEIDSMVPTSDPRFSFLAKGKIQPFARIKTIRLKGILSQGLLMPGSIITPAEADQIADITDNDGNDFSTVFNVRKYEPPLPTGGQQKGTFPSNLIPKTDQERIQNMSSVLNGRMLREFEITEKLDGTSCTIWYHRKEGVVVPQDSAQIELRRNPYVGVASRNWEMDRDDDNVYAKILRSNDLVVKLGRLGRNIAVQGEIIGPGIQGNKYKRAQQEFYVFDIYDIDAKQYVTSAERMELVRRLELSHVPVPSYHQLLMGVPEAQPVQQGTDDFPLSLDVVLSMADGQSMLHITKREGLVFKHRTDPSLTFKAISNKWLLKYE